MNAFLGGKKKKKKKNKIETNLQNRNRLTDVENEFMVTKRQMGEG